MAHNYETGGLRRVYLRGHRNILKRILVHVAGFNLGLVMQKIAGHGTPRSLQDRFLRLLAVIFAAIQALLLPSNSVSQPAQLHAPVRRHLVSLGWLSEDFSRQPTFATGC